MIYKRHLVIFDRPKEAEELKLEQKLLLKKPKAKAKNLQQEMAWQVLSKHLPNGNVPGEDLLKT